MEFPSDGSSQDQVTDFSAAFTADGTTAYIMTAVAGRGNGYLNAIDTDPTIASASTQVWSTDLSFNSRKKRGVLVVTSYVLVRKLPGADVTAYRTKLDGLVVTQ